MLVSATDWDIFLFYTSFAELRDSGLLIYNSSNKLYLTSSLRRLLFKISGLNLERDFFYSSSKSKSFMKLDPRKLLDPSNFESSLSLAPSI